jgi:AcrR family transcriptional regulator
MVFRMKGPYNKFKGFGQMDSLKDSLIRATIVEGASNPSNKRFSTKAIAESCGVSEFTLFAIFKTKDALVEAAKARASEDFVLSAQRLARVSKDVGALVKGLLAHAFEVPEYTIFLANYGFWTGRLEADEVKKKADFDHDVLSAKQAFIFLKDYPDEVVYLLWNYVLRQINYAVEEVYDGLAVDSRSYRDAVSQVVSEGILSFPKEATNGTPGN